MLSAELVETLGDDAAVRVAATAGLAHVERDVIGNGAVLSAGGDVEVRREHARSRVAHLRANSVPGTSVELLLDAVLGELNHAPGHVLGFVAVVAPDGTDPCLAIDQLGDVPLVIERVEVVEQLVGRARAGGAVHHVGDVSDLGGTVLPIVIDHARGLEEVGREGRDGPQAVGVRLLLGDDLAKGGLNAAMCVDVQFQCHVPPLSPTNSSGPRARALRCVHDHVWDKWQAGAKLVGKQYASPYIL